MRVFVVDNIPYEKRIVVCAENRDEAKNIIIDKYLLRVKTFEMKEAHPVKGRLFIKVDCPQCGTENECPIKEPDTLIPRIAYCRNCGDVFSVEIE